jgi:SAM-dependent methyltransferase
MMGGLTNIDWRTEWFEQYKLRREPGDASYWDVRSVGFVRKHEHSSYAEDFIGLAALTPGQSVLDVGCGAGTLSLPLANAGHPVLAVDFSPGMLDGLKDRAQREQTQGIEWRLLSWTDDWPAAGVGRKSVDVALASRSLIVADLWEALVKLDETARDKVCVTMATSHGPRSAEAIMAKLGRETPRRPDFVYGMNMLFQMGIEPQLRYVDSYKNDCFTNSDDAFEDFRDRIEGMTPADERALKDYLTTHLVKVDSETLSSAHAPRDMNGRPATVMLPEKRLIRWAFISWVPQST